MPKSILGDDPFAEDFIKQEKPRAASKKKKPAKPFKKKAPAAKKKKKPARPTKKKAVTPLAKKMAVKPTTKKAAKPKKKKPPVTPKKKAVPKTKEETGTSSYKKMPVEFKVEGGWPPMADGASARRAARAITSQGDAPPRVAASTFSGPGLEPSTETTSPTGSLLNDFKRFERQISTRLKGEEAPLDAAPHSTSLMDQIGQLMDPHFYRKWISNQMMRNRSDVVDDFGLDAVYAERWRPMFKFLYRQYWRVETTGIENIPDQHRALLVSNHSGTLPYDGAMIMYALRYDHPAHRNVRPLVEDFIFHFPFLGAFLNRVGCVRACQENATRLLQQNQTVVVFPEGIKGISKLYRNRYQLQRFGRGGFIKLAFKTRTPIIPTAVVGAEEIHPMLTQITWLAKYLGFPFVPITPTFPWLGPLGLIPMPTKWSIRFGEPIDLVGKYGPDAYKDRLLVSKRTEHVRSTIQGLVDESLSRRRSAIFG